MSAGTKGLSTAPPPAAHARCRRGALHAGGRRPGPMRAPGGLTARRRDARQLRPVMAALFSADAKDRDEKAYQAAPGEAKVRAAVPSLVAALKGGRCCGTN